MAQTYYPSPPNGAHPQQVHVEMRQLFPQSARMGDQFDLNSSTYPPATSDFSVGTILKWLLWLAIFGLALATLIILAVRDDSDNDTILLSAPSSAASVASVASAAAIVGANVRVSWMDDWTPFWTSAQYEPTIAVNPTNPQNLVAGYIDYHTQQPAICPFDPTINRTRCRYQPDGSITGYAFSNDGGATWTQGTFLPNPAVGIDEMHSDTIVVFGPKPDASAPSGFSFTNGARAYFFALTNIYTELGPVAMSVSDDGGATWTPMVFIGRRPTNLNVAGQGWDKEEAAVDTDPSSPFFGRVYVAHAVFQGSGNAQNIDVGNGNRGGAAAVKLLVHYSADGGATWTEGVQIAPPIQNKNQGPVYTNPYIQVSVGKGGVLYLLWDRGDAIVMETSSDGGNSFSTATRAFPSPMMPANFPGDVNHIFLDYQSWGPGLGMRAILARTPGLMADPVTPNKVHTTANLLSYNSQTGKFHSVLSYAVSTNRGATFSAPRTLVDLGNVGRSIAYAAVDISADGQTLAVLYMTYPEYAAYPTWTLPGTSQGSVMRYELAYSKDGGATWTTGVVVSPYMDPNAAIRYNFYYGFLQDYIDLKLYQDPITGAVTAYGIWGDTRNAANCQAAWDYANAGFLGLPQPYFDFYASCPATNSFNTDIYTSAISL